LPIIANRPSPADPTDVAPHSSIEIILCPASYTDTPSPLSNRELEIAIGKAPPQQQFNKNYWTYQKTSKAHFFLPVAASKSKNNIEPAKEATATTAKFHLLLPSKAKPKMATRIL
jgi:hypothetical protein